MNEQQDRTKVIILTHRYRIDGEIANFSDSRLTDFMTEAKNFIAVTDAEVLDRTNGQSVSTAFLNVHRDMIEVIIPVDQVILDEIHFAAKE